MKKGRKKQALGLIIVLFLLLILSIFIYSFKSTPQIISASVYPTKVRPGDVMLITVAVKGNINSVIAENTHDKGSDKINLQLLKKRVNGSRIYEGSWIVHDTTGEKTYNTYITVTGKLGKTASDQVEWLDPTVTHKASEILSGTFGSGDYVFPGNLDVTENLNVSGNLSVNGTIAIATLSSVPPTVEGYAKLYFIKDSDEYTRLLLHMDGSDGSTTFKDSSIYNHSLTAADNVQLNTAQKEFGTASALFDGTDDKLTCVDSDINFGTGEFTIDFWYRMSALPDDTHTLFASLSGSDLAIYHAINGEDKRIQVYFSGSTYKFAWVASVDTWYHVAIVRTGDILKVFIAGTQIGTNEDVTGNTVADETSYHISASGNNAISGWLDEYRISKGIARWTSNFAVPTSPYSGGLFFKNSEGNVTKIA